MKIINVIAPYRHHGSWVFDDPRVGLIQESFISGADALIDRAAANIVGADHGFFLIFSERPFPGHAIRLNWRHYDMDGNWYCAEGREDEAWLCPALMKYFDDIPKVLYLQCKAKPQTAKHPSEWAVEEPRRIADDGSDSAEPVAPSELSGAEAQLWHTQAEHILPDPALAQLERFATGAWLRNGAVLALFLIVIVNIVLATIGLLGGNRPSRYVFLFFVWIMGITGLVILARLWRAMVMLRRLQSGESAT